VTIIYAGIALGALYAITALLYNITVATSGIFSFAASQYVMVGAFVSYVTTTQLGLNPLLAIPIGAVIGGVLGWLTELVAIRPLRDKTGWAALVTTVGVGTAISGIAYAIWGSNPYLVPFIVPNDPVDIAGGTTTVVDIWLFIASVVLCGAGFLFHRFTRFGLMGRAATSDLQAALVRGVNVPRLTMMSFIVSGALGGALGFLIAPKTTVNFSLGATLVVFAFAALTIGGFGSYVGTWVGGMIVGLVQALSERYVGGSSPLIVVFILLLAVLLIRPTGIFGSRRVRTV
jgi:branched-chain amino acid transport system permease protein